MKGHFIDFIEKKMNKHMLKFVFAYKYVPTSIKVHEIFFNKFFENKMAAQNLSQMNPFFFGQTSRPDHYWSQFCT